MHEAMGMNLGSLEAVITEFAPVLEDLGFYWFEEAFGGTQFDHIELFLQLKEATPTVLVSGGERFLERFEAQEWLDHRALDIVQSDCNVTGLTETGISRGWRISGVFAASRTTGTAVAQRW
jgi:L-alanine-DL-glutamate epimerase-like enolase superfamily enzyme